MMIGTVVYGLEWHDWYRLLRDNVLICTLSELLHLVQRDADQFVLGERY